MLALRQHELGVREIIQTGGAKACGGAGMPCPSCNVCDEDHPPRLPAGFQLDESLDDDQAVTASPSWN